MPADRRFTQFLCTNVAHGALAVAVPGLCLVTSLLLATPPAAAATPCGAGTALQGCGAAATGSVAPAASTSRHLPAAGAAAITAPAPCGPGVSGAGCAAGAAHPMGPGVAQLRPNLPLGMQRFRADPCPPGIRVPGMPGCGPGAAGAVLQGVASFMQMLAPPPPPSPSPSPPH